MGYDFYMGKILLPVTPSKLQLKVGNANKTVTLMNDGEINILRTPKLTDISFEILLPHTNYNFTNRGFKKIEYYLEQFENWKVNKKTFQFIVARQLPNGKSMYGTNMKVSLEDYTVTESADDNFDTVVSIKLKQYRDYGTKICKIDTSKKKVAAKKKRSTGDNAPSGKTYTVVNGDNLWKISRKCYGSATSASVKSIYDTNKEVIEKVAKEHGKTSSNNGWWIWAGTVLTIPKV